MSSITVEPMKAVLNDCPEAMKFIALKFIPIHEIRESQNGNLARSRGVTNEGVKKFVKVMKSNEYLPFYYVPPVVVEIPENDSRRLNDDGENQYRYELVAGHHRYHAHLTYGKPDFYAQIVEFVKAKGKSPNHWKTVYQTLENMEGSERYVRTYATDEDITTAINNLLEEELNSQEVPPPFETILSTIFSQLNITSRGEITRLTNRLYKLRGNSVKVVHGITPQIRENYITLHQKFTKKLREHTLYQNFTVGGAEVEDYDYRGISKVWNMVEADSNTLSKLHLIAGTSKSNHAEVPSVRKNKETLFKRHAEDVIRRAAFLLGITPEKLMSLKTGTRYETFCNIPIYWIPQLHGEKDIVLKSKSLIRVKKESRNG